MSWSYNPEDLATSVKDQVRFMIGDTDSEIAYLQDEEINYLLSVNGNSVSNTVLQSVRRIIAVLTSQVDYKIGPEQVWASDRLKNYLNLLKELEKQFAGIGYMCLSLPANSGGGIPYFYPGITDFHRNSSTPNINGCGCNSLEGSWTP